MMRRLLFCVSISALLWQVTGVRADLPPVIPGASEGWLYELVRNAEMVLVVVDANDDDVLSETDEILEALSEHGIGACVVYG